MFRICRRGRTWSHTLTGPFLALGALAILISACGRTPLNPSQADSAAAGRGEETGIPGVDGSSEMGPNPRIDGSGAAASCLIASVRYQEGAANPQNPCQSCQPSRSTTGWSDLGSGSGCLGLGPYHSCAVVNGSAWCWGFNLYGELGNNSTTSSTIAVPVYGLSSGVQAIASSFADGYAIVNGGSQAWGRNGGYLGNNSTADSLVPVHVQGLSSGVESVVACPTHTCALSGGQVWCWGDGKAGELGTSGNQGLVPVRVQGLASGVQAIACGQYYTCALVADSVWCWGHIHYVPSSPDYINAPPAGPSPTKIDGLPSGMQSIAASDTVTCVIANGDVWCWGETWLADPAVNLVPWMVSGLPSPVRAIAVGGTDLGDNHACALLDDGLMCWGSNAFGQIGQTPPDYNPAVPVRVHGLPSPVQAVAAGELHTCALAAGQVWCWGSNYTGQLGNDSTSNSSVPVLVQGLPGS
jgi:alpha-tubulin suppressor-like RCC1 family protein